MNWTRVFMLFERQTCCAVVFCSKDCRRKASQGYHRFSEFSRSQNCFLFFQVRVRDETLWASSHGGQGHVWLLSCTEVAFSIYIFFFLSENTISGQSLRGILTTFSTTSKCLRCPSMIFLDPPCCRCSSTRRNQSFQRRESTPAGITRLSWTWSESTTR